MVPKPPSFSQFRQFLSRRTVSIFLLLILLAAISSCRDQKSQSFSTGYDETQSNTPVVSEDTPDFYDQFNAPFPCAPSPGPGMPEFSPGKSITAVELSGSSMPSSDDCVIKQAPPVQHIFEFYTTMGGPDGNRIKDIEADKITFLKSDEKDELPGLFSQNLPKKIKTVSNKEFISVQNTTFSWQRAEDAHWYYIWVRDSGTMNGLPRLARWIHAEDANCSDNQELCRWVSNTTFAEGPVHWWIRAFNNAGEGPWSDKNEFEIAEANSTVPPTPVKLSPNTNVDTNRPTFEWEAEPLASDYALLVRDSETMEHPDSRIFIWITAGEAGCSSGTGTCTWTANTDLVAGEARWWVRARNSAGKSTFGHPMEFSVTQNVPPTPVKLSPNTNVDTNRPTFEWEAEPLASDYALLVRDSETLEHPDSRIFIWITAGEAGCSSGTGTCTWTANTDLVAGEARWWVRARNSAGKSTFGHPMNFSVTQNVPPTPVKLFPNTNVDTNRPTFEWEAEPLASDYALLVRDSETLEHPDSRIFIWITAGEAGCSSGTGTCTWTANTDLVAGEARWWVRARNSAGKSTFGHPMEFSVTQNVPPTPVKLSPNTNVDTNRPTFEWEAEPLASDYALLVRDSETLEHPDSRIFIWITSGEAGCSSGTGTCTWTANTDLVAGEARWWVRARNSAGKSTFGHPMKFFVSEESPSNDFVSISNSNFMLNGDVFRFAGTNAYYLPNYEKIDPGFVTGTLNEFEQAGITVVRMWGFYDGYDCGYSQQDPTENVIQTSPGIYSESALQDLDNVIAKGKNRGIMFLLTFLNYWDDLGGICQYNTWAGASNPSTNMTYFINSNTTQQWFKNYISMLLNRVNTVTGVAYKNEPAIFGWEIINEGRNSGQNPTVLRDWYSDIAQYIKSIDSNHPLTTGEEGFDDGTPSQYSVNQYSNTYVLRAEEGTSYLLNIAIPEIDFGSAHWYPTDWGFGYEVTQDMINAQHAWLNDHEVIATNVGKPFFLGEYGYPGWANQAQIDNYEDLWNHAEDIELDGSMLWQFTIDYVKCYEFGGNICWPEGRQDTDLYNNFSSHIQNMSNSN